MHLNVSTISSLRLLILLSPAALQELQSLWTAARCLNVGHILVHVEHSEILYLPNNIIAGLFPSYADHSAIPDSVYERRPGKDHWLACTSRKPSVSVGKEMEFGRKTKGLQNRVFKKRKSTRKVRDTFASEKLKKFNFHLTSIQHALIELE